MPTVKFRSEDLKLHICHLDDFLAIRSDCITTAVLHTAPWYPPRTTSRHSQVFPFMRPSKPLCAVKSQSFKATLKQCIDAITS